MMVQEKPSTPDVADAVARLFRPNRVSRRWRGCVRSRDGCQASAFETFLVTAKTAGGNPERPGDIILTRVAGFKEGDQGICFSGTVGDIVVRKHDTMDENDALRSFSAEIDVVVNENESGCWIEPKEFLLFW
jgi:hypothetical protein